MEVVAEVSVLLSCLAFFLFSMELRKSIGQSESVVVLPLEVAPTLVRPGRKSGVFEYEGERRDEVGRMIEESWLDILGLSDRNWRGGWRNEFWGG